MEKQKTIIKKDYIRKKTSELKLKASKFVKKTGKIGADKSALKKDVESKDQVKIKKSYLYAIGRRKEASAQVKLFKKGDGKIEINSKDIKDYFPNDFIRAIVYAPLKTVGQVDRLNICAKVVGGGLCGQAEAIRHGISRALLEINTNFKKPLRKQCYLTRDPRVKERKKPGLKRARRAPQWQKR